MKKIILIQPKVGSWEFIQETPMLPVALLQISAYLTDEYAIRIIDQRLDREWARTLKSELTGDVLCVGVTTMTGPQILYALEASKIVKQYGAIPVIWGGIHPSILPEQTLNNPYVDIVVTGEGEIVFRDLVRSLDKKQPFAGLPGVWVKTGGKASGSAPQTIRDINTLPPVPYGLVRVEDYIGHDREGRKKFPIQTARGCPYRCTFCHQTGKYRKSWRSLDAGRVLNDIKTLKDKYGIRHFQILDDNFFVNADRAHSILKGIVDLRLDIVFTINGTRVTDILRMKDETIELLARGGCYEVQVGLESGSQRVLDHMKKDITLPQIFEANQRLKEHNIPRYYELVSGFRDETKEDLSRTAGVILELSKDDPGVFFSPLECLTPYPGTEVYAQAESAGMKFPEDLEGWGRYQWDKAQLPWLGKDRTKLLEAFHIFPTFISHEIKTMRSPVFKGIFKIYRVWARFRVRRLFFSLPIETFLFDLMARLRS
ncbi:B12-binding domain-containing radical SAM protein [Candidatus Omnitrophota bacterium]